MIARRRSLACAVATITATPSVADAHLVSTELGPFYDGAAHTVVSVGDLLTILVLAILASFAGRTAGRRLLLSLTGSWALGASAAFGALALPATTTRFVAPSLLLALGLLGLFRARLPAAALWIAGALIGLLLGLLNGSAARVEDGRWLTVIGMVVGVFVTTSMLLAAGVWTEQRGGTVVLRVAASWIAAIGLLMLGWELRTP
jgi:hydrogenase/urease accessory protein HupE